MAAGVPRPVARLVRGRVIALPTAAAVAGRRASGPRAADPRNGDDQGRMTPSPSRPGDRPMSRAASEYRYEKLTWPEINDAVELGKVCIVPCGAVQQHGPHLPLDVDLICPTEIARAAGREIPDQLLILPTVCYGYTGHVMDFPGTINN